METKAFVRVNCGELEYLTVTSNSPQWRKKLCPFHSIDGEWPECSEQCALFWYDGRSVTLLCVGETFAVIRQPQHAERQEDTETQTRGD